MARINTARRFADAVTADGRTHGGAIAVKVGDFASLRRSVLATFLNEKQFYEDGEEILERIRRLAVACDPDSVARLAIEARKEHGLRHAPLALLVALTRTSRGVPNLVADTIASVVSRADEVGELVALYWADGGRRPLSAQMKKGLRRAIAKFDRFQLARYANMQADVRLRDVLFLVHAKPSQGMAETFKALADDALKSADTWEVELSAGKDKKETFERLLQEGRLGYLALLRNLRGMQDAGVSSELVIEAIRARKGARGVLPFQFLSAAEQAPRFAIHVQKALLAHFEAMPKLKGKTVIIGDASGSMNASLSDRSARSRLDAQAILMGCLVAMCEDPVVYATAGSDGSRIHDTRQVKAVAGMEMVEVMQQALRRQGHGGIFLKQCMDHVREMEKTADRIIVFTDEQDCDRSGAGQPAKADAFGKRNYLINVASAKNGIGYKKWVHVDGFSEAVLKWIPAFEASEDAEQMDAEAA